MATRILHLSRLAYSGATVPYKRWNGSSYVDWDDTADAETFRMSDEPAAGFSTKTITQSNSWSPFLNHRLGLYQFISYPFVLASPTSIRISINTSRFRVSQNHVDVDLEWIADLRLVQSDGSLRTHLLGIFGGIPPYASSLTAVSSGSNSKLTTIYDGDMLVWEFGFWNLDSVYVAGRTASMEMGGGSGSLLTAGDTSQHDPYLSLNDNFTLVGDPPVATTSYRTRILTPLKRPHRPEQLSTAATQAAPLLGDTFLGE